ncbi:FtsX-like permease family protein [Kiloniella laminariae]|uniref:FtsX-like permease family protein n=1 Tax=Kiloniella laminariae TaxID=454162 RepID=A0ABT4LIW0_9PROT|nr:FtsX-like permease family protein [Kiloniella laminariae]MCZ4281045.1 FtsX-like permease family protein [Kiloniella laminariae]
MRHSLPFSLAMTFALRELRGGIKGFRIFLGCLFLGVSAIAAVGSISASIEQGLRNDGRNLLGGDIALNLVHQQATPEQINWLGDRGKVSLVREMRAMGRQDQPSGKRTLIELRAVDNVYPLYGDIVLDPAAPLQDVLEMKDGQWGAVVAPNLLRKLDLNIGDIIVVGDTRYVVRGALIKEPDLSTRAFTYGPTVMVSGDSLESTGLIQPGSMVRYDYRLALPLSTDLAQFQNQLGTSFPDAGWRVRSSEQAAPRISQFIDILGMYLTLIGLATLLVGGVGVANAVKSFMDSKVAIIATFKCLGASSSLIFQIYLAQILFLTLAGTLAGLLAGAAAPYFAASFAGDILGWDIAAGLYPEPLLLAAAFGFLTALTFSLWSLSRAGKTSPARLFQDLTSPITGRPTPRALCVLALSSALLALTAVAFSSNPKIAGFFITGAIATFMIYHFVGWVVTRLTRALPRASHPALRTAIANLHRPGAPTSSVILSMGLGLTVLVIVALLEGNVSRAVTQSLPEEAPGFYFIDIQPEQVEDFEKLVLATDGVSELHRVPMMRGRITAVKGTSPDELEIPSEIKWVFRSDRGLTWSAEMPENTKIVAGDWWPEDYNGKPLVSLDEQVAKGLNLSLGDSLTINLLGRPIEVEIANLRKIDWGGLEINFVMVFSPGLMSRAPQTHIATVKAAPEIEDALEIAVTDRFANVSSIRVKEALQAATELLGHVALALSVIATVALLAGTLVLGGAVAAGHQRRVYDAVVLKVLGASRRALTLTFFLEFGLLGIISASVAVVIGSIASWAITVYILRLEFSLLSEVMILTPLIALVATLLCGYIGTWSALRQRPAPLLRNQ